MPYGRRTYKPRTFSRRPAARTARSKLVSKKRLSSTNKRTVRRIVSQVAGQPKLHYSELTFNNLSSNRGWVVPPTPHFLHQKPIWDDGNNFPVSAERPVWVALNQFTENASNFKMDPRPGSESPDGKKVYMKWINLRLRYICGDTPTLFRTFLIKPILGSFDVADFKNADSDWIDTTKYRILSQKKWKMSGHPGEPAHLDQNQTVWSNHQASDADKNHEPNTDNNDMTEHGTPVGTSFKVVDWNIKVNKMMYNALGQDSFPIQKDLVLVICCSDPYDDGTGNSWYTTNDHHHCSVEIKRRIQYSDFE